MAVKSHTSQYFCSCPYTYEYLKKYTLGSKTSRCICTSCRSPKEILYRVGDMEDLAAVAIGIKPLAVCKFPTEQRSGKIPKKYDAKIYKQIIAYAKQQGVKYMCRNEKVVVFYLPHNEKYAITWFSYLSTPRSDLVTDIAAGYLLGYDKKNIYNYISYKKSKTPDVKNFRSVIADLDRQLNAANKIDLKRLKLKIDTL